MSEIIKKNGWLVEFHVEHDFGRNELFAVIVAAKNSTEAITYARGVLAFEEVESALDIYARKVSTI